MMQFEAVALSHQGLRRPGNEDSGYAGTSLLVVADGVGGAAAGEVASTTATTLAAALAPGDPWGPPVPPAALLGTIAERAATLLRTHVAHHPEATGLGTTLTAMLTDGTRCGLVHLGDSRAHVLRGGRLHRLTAEHSWGEAMVADGHLTREQAERSPYRRRLMRWLGAEDPALGHGRPDLGHLELMEGDRVLLASDGLSDEVSEDLVSHLLATGSPGDAAEQLVAAALSAGGRDNVTVVVADVVDRPEVRHVGTLVGAAAATVPEWKKESEPTASR